MTAGMTATSGCSGRRSVPVDHRAGLPTVTADPGAFSAPGSLTQERGEIGPAATGPERRAKPKPQPKPDPKTTRTTVTRLARIQHELSQRDHDILRSVQRHRFLTTAHIQAFHFSDHATEDAASRICRRVLMRLLEGRLIEHLERRIGGVRAGSGSYVWRVGLVGDQVLRRASGDGVRGRRKEPSARYLEHCLAIADAHLALVTAARAGRLELLRADTEPACWRHYQGAGGQPEVLKPDLHAVTGSCEFEDHWFIEMDRATESLPTLLGKCAQYEHYRRTGREQHDGGVFPAVVWVVPDQFRLDKLRAALSGSRTLDSDLYRICTPDSFADLICRGAA